MTKNLSEWLLSGVFWGVGGKSKGSKCGRDC